MHNTTLLVQIPQAVCDLQDDVTSKVLAEIRELDDLMEQLATLANCLKMVNTITLTSSTATHVQGQDSSTRLTPKTG
jgi:hypothetical protein